MKRNKHCLLALICAVVLISCEQTNSETEEAQAYKLLEIKSDSIALTRTYSASIRGRQDIRIIPRVEGYLTETAIKEGSKVRNGQTLFVIDQVPYLAALEAAKAQVAVCEATVGTSHLTFNSKQSLYQKKIVSEFDLKTAENALRTAEAQLKQAKAQEVSAQNNLSYTVIKSPSDGVVGKLPYRKGDYVNPSIQDGLTIVADNSQMYVYFSMTERQVLDLITQYSNIDAAIAGMPNVQLRLSNQTIYPHSGRIESISGVVETTTGAVSVRAAFPNKEGHLLSGGAGSVIVPYTSNNVIIVPQEATYEIQDKTYIYKVVDGKAVSAIVSVDKINDGKLYIVTDGISIGETIIAEGAGLVREGTKIKQVAAKE